MAARASERSTQNNPRIKAGYTFLGQFIDHDLTLDATSNLEQQIDPQAHRGTSARRRSSSTASTASGRRCSPTSTRRTTPGKHAARPGRVRPAAQQRGHRADRRPAQRREHHRLAVPPADAEVPQQGVRRAHRHVDGHAGALRGGAADRALALPVDRDQRVPGAHRRQGVRSRRRSSRCPFKFPEDATPSCRSSSAWRPTASATARCGRATCSARRGPSRSARRRIFPERSPTRPRAWATCAAAAWCPRAPRRLEGVLRSGRRRPAS